MTGGRPHLRHSESQAPGQWASADYWQRRELLHEWLDHLGGWTVAGIASLFKADSHEITAKLMSLKVEGRVVYDRRHKWWQAA